MGPDSSTSVCLLARPLQLGIAKSCQTRRVFIYLSSLNFTPEPRLSYQKKHNKKLGWTKYLEKENMNMFLWRCCGGLSESTETTISLASLTCWPVDYVFSRLELECEGRK